MEDVRESTEKSNTNLIAESSASTEDNSVKQKVEENKKEDMEMSQELLEKQARVNDAFVESHTKQMIRLAKSKTNLVEAQGILQDLLNTIGLEKKEIREKVESELSDLTAKLEEQVKLSEKTLQEKEITFADLSKKHNLLIESFKKLQEKHKSLVETNTELVEDREVMLKDINQFISDRKLMEADLEKYGSFTKEGQGKFKVLTENVKLMESDLNQFLKDRKLMESDINQFMEDRKLMEADIKQFTEDKTNMQKDIDQLVEDRKNMLADIKQFLKERELMQKDISLLVADRSKMQEDIQFLVEKLTKFDESAKESEYLTYSYSPKEATSVARSTDENEKSELGDMENPEMKKIIGKTGFVENHDEFENDMDGLNSDMEHGHKHGEEDEELEETMMEKRKKKAKKDEDEKKQKMKESTSNFYKNEITKFYLEEAKKVPALEDFEEEILSSKSLVEAVRKVDKIKGKSTSDSPVRLTEKTSFTSSHTDWLRSSDY
jgi:chromosome segregation ATPase